jgi:hypothetical protein
VATAPAPCPPASPHRSQGPTSPTAPPARAKWCVANALPSVGTRRGRGGRRRRYSAGQRARSAEHVARACGRRGCGLGGAALRRGGIGKTSLVRSFLEQARTARGVLLGTCDDLFTPHVRWPLRDVARAGAGLLDGAPVEGDRDAILSATLAELALRRARRCSWFRTCTGPTTPPSDVLRYVGRRLENVPIGVWDDLPDEGGEGGPATGAGSARRSLRSSSEAQVESVVPLVDHPVRRHLGGGASA